MKGASVWLCFVTTLPAATMMHPTFASLIAICFVLGGAFAIRAAARWEAKGEGRT